MTTSQTIVRGIELSSAGHAVIDPGLTETLITIAIALDDRMRFPVDVEHVVAGICLAARSGQLTAETCLDPHDAAQQDIIQAAVETVFTAYHGVVGDEDA